MASYSRWSTASSPTTRRRTSSRKVRAHRSVADVARDARQRRSRQGRSRRKKTSYHEADPSAVLRAFASSWLNSRVQLKAKLREAIERLTAAEVGSPRLNAETLMMFTLGID